MYTLKELPIRFLLGIVAMLAIGCSSQKPPDQAMTTSPTGLWIGQSNSDVSLDIQDGGFIKMVRDGKETVGQWASSGEDAIQATFDGQSYSMPFQRRDLTLKITLPGESSPSEFGQM